MSAVTVSGAPAIDAKRGGLRLVLTACPLCGADEGEPAAVGSDVAWGVSRDSFLALSCPACGLVYLNPRPAAEERVRLYPPEYFAASTAAGNERIAVAALRRLVRQLRPELPTAHVLEVCSGPRLLLASHREVMPDGWSVSAVTPHSPAADHARAAGLAVSECEVRALERSGPAYDLVLLYQALEHWESPTDELAAVRRLLRDGGHVLVLTPNAESTAARAFRGRHWTGYDFPRHPCLFGPRALRRLAGVAGLETERLGTVDDPRAWAGSAANFLRDWGAPGWLARTGPELLGLGSRLGAVRGPWRQAHGGAVLEAVLRAPGAAA